MRDKMHTSKGTNRGYKLCVGNGRLENRYQQEDEAAGRDGNPTEKAGEPHGFDEVDLSISAHHGKTKYDVEAARKRKNPGGRTKDERSVPSYWFLLMVVLLGVGFFVALGLGLGLGHPDPKLNPYQFYNGAVASDRLLCSEVGRDLMKNGGNALDAAIGTAFCVGVLNLHVGGVGGGGYLTFYNKSSVNVENGVTTVAINGHAVAPAGASEDMFTDREGEATQGGMAIAIPGEVAGLYQAHKTYGGALSWASLVEPSIRLAKRGFSIGEALANAIAANEEAILADPGLREILMDGDGLKQRGEEVVLPKLAATLETIAASGADGFYKGELAQKIVDDVNDTGGNITLEDLKTYSAHISQTVSVELGGGELYAARGITAYAPPPPSSGILTNYILNILEGYDLYWGSTANTENEVETYHRMLEAYKFALADRSRLGDPEFEESVKEVTDELVKTSTATATREKIQDKALKFPEYGSKYAPKMDAAGGATHISVKDKAGNAVSYTTSISSDFGAKVRGTRTGIIFNAAMGDFSLPSSSAVHGLQPSPANFIKPGKRPLTSMTPLVLVDKDDEVKAVIGASGGLQMITASAMMAVQTIWFEDNVIDAMERARFHADLSQVSATDLVEYGHESALDSTVIGGLSARDQIEDKNLPLVSAVNLIIQTKKNRWYTNSDNRAPGSGYALY
ncbi:gamma-glutamyltranspeptidase 1-like isoform X2 [Acanthaster planci]|uniref:Gamma-glutamyltranspeptidase 1-like isoform X2 n=1 Tax=Acanthaster planci TaxID=133434 RepID=A0A8B7ZD11_ACAPL|nr:gamma-glutamyltranspeptidase 1-like isoform X2 [Acanthaster planci]